MSETVNPDRLAERRRRYLLVRRIVIGVAIAFGVLIVGTLLLLVQLNREHISDVTTLNAGGTAGSVLVVYHPGGTDFQREATEAFAATLAGRGFSVDITTASSQAPTDIHSYDLLVLGAPVYAGKPGKPLITYVQSLGDLNQEPTVVIISGQGATDGAEAFTEELMADANASLLKLLVLWTSAPNEEMYGIGDPTEIMKREAQSLVVP